MHSPLLSQKSVILATQPVDPFDLIRGQYIIIVYEINTIPFINGTKIGDSVYVILQEDENKTSRYKESSLTKPNEGTFIKLKLPQLRLLLPI